jgi:hypothetical protein
VCQHLALTQTKREALAPIVIIVPQLFSDCAFYLNKDFTSPADIESAYAELEPKPNKPEPDGNDLDQYRD